MAITAPNLAAVTVHSGPTITHVGITGRLAGGVVHNVTPDPVAGHEVGRNEDLVNVYDIFHSHDLTVSVEYEVLSDASGSIGNYAVGTKFDYGTFTLLRASEGTGHNTGSGSITLMLENKPKVERGKPTMRSLKFAFRTYAT
jgi:hypothetical protein